MLNRLIHKVTKGFAYVSAVIFALIVLIVLANIIGRAVFNKPIKGTVEIVQYGVMFCAGIVMCRSGLEERHISVTFLIDKYPKRVRAALHRARKAPRHDGLRRARGDLYRQYLRSNPDGKADGHLPAAV